MNCIDSIKLQKYIDNECTEKTRAAIERHLSECNSCSVRYRQQLEQSKRIKASLNVLNINTDEIPAFEKQAIKTKSHSIKKYIIYSLSAACLLLFILIFVDKKPNNTQNQLVLTNNQEFDSNKPITGQPLVISIIDPEGNCSEFYLQ